MTPSLRTSSDLRRVVLLNFVCAAAVLFSCSAATKYEFDGCDMPDRSPGVCRVFEECLPLIDLLKKGEISIDEPTRCGFKGRDELICCPSDVAVVTQTTTPFIFDGSHEVQGHTSANSAATTTTAKPDFWLHLLDSSTTTAKPDFWLHLLNTTTTTPKPLVIGSEQLDNNSQFYDFSKLLQPGASGAPLDTNTQNFPIASPGNSPITNQNIPIIHQQFPDVNGNVLGHEFENRPGINGVQNGFAHGNGRGGRGFGNGQGPMDEFNFAEIQGNNLGNGRSADGFGVGRRWGNGVGNGFPNPGRGNGKGFGNGPGRGNGNGFGSGPGRGNGNGFGDGSVRGNGRGNGRGRGNGIGFGNGIAIENGLGFDNIGNEFGNAEVVVVNPSPGPTWLSPRPMVNTFPAENPNILWPNQVHVQAPNEQPQVLFVDNESPTIFQSGDPNIGAPVATWNTGANEAIQQSNFSPTPELTGPLTFGASLPKDPQTDAENHSFGNVRQPDENQWFWSSPNIISPTDPRTTSNANSRTMPTSTSTSTTTTKRPTIRPAVRTERPSVAACRMIEQNLSVFLTPHILDGTPVAPGEYPHMAAIGYALIGSEDGPYDFRCGGTLIHERFVLTAAHCVNSRNVTPAIVRLGMADFDDSDEIPNRQEIQIKAVHIHDNYSNRWKYDDIALLELQRAAQFNAYVYPTCLYTELEDPPSNSPLYVTGWGTLNTKTRMRSGILLKAQLQIVSLENCNSSYVEFGLTRQLDRGVLRTQLCARDPGLTKDACQGDSGGPLNMIVDESTKNFRVVGVISTGFGCASSVPGLYTRVSAYLDFIENIVWPSY